MPSAISLKSDPLGVVDTRLMMTNSPDDSFLPPFFSPLAGLGDTADKKQANQTVPDTSPKRAHGLLELRESFRGFDSNRKCPRLELDAAVDKYHTLDGLAEPLNPQNTPASNSERGGTEESPESLRCYKMENMRISPLSQREEFNFDCFQVSPDASFVRQERRSESPKPLKVRSYSLGDRHWVKFPVTDQATHPRYSNANTLKASGNPGSVLRSVHFSPPAASLSLPFRVMRRPLPSIERRQNYVAFYRQKKQYQKWKVTRRANLRRGSPCNSPKNIVPPLVAHIPNDHNVRVPSLSGLPSRELHRTPVSTRVGPDNTLELRASNVAGTLVPDCSSNAGNAKYKIPDFLAVSFSLYRIRHLPGSPSGKAPKYAFKFRITQTVLPQHPSPHIPTTLEQIACRPAIDDLLLHTCFIIPALVVMVPLSIILFTMGLLTETRLGAVVAHLVSALLCLMMNIIELVLTKCGVTCSCQWSPDTCYSD